MKGLAGKRVVVTGGASGIGAAIVERFLEEGSRVAVIDVDAAAGRSLREKHPGLAGVIAADVSDPDAVERAFRELDGLLGGLDVAINNAGISIRHDFMSITPAEWRKVMGIDLDGVVAAAERELGHGALTAGPRRSGGRRRLAPAAREALACALRQARALGDRELRAEHLLLGVLAQRADRVPADVLAG